MFPADIERLSRSVIDHARSRGWTVATAESCTGGLVSAALTAIAGSSDVFTQGFVTYANQAKTAALGVPADLIAQAGAVSAEVAEAMAEGAARASGVDLAVSITGIAGPGGGSPDKPVGLVWFGLARKGAPTVSREERFGDIGRAEVRAASVRVALQLLLKAVADDGA